MASVNINKPFDFFTRTKLEIRKDGTFRCNEISTIDD